MTARCLCRRLAREWLVALLAYALLVAPFGCQLAADLEGNVGGDQLTTASAGLFVNSAALSPLLAAGRNAAGDAFFVYGTRTLDGGIREIESLRVRTAAGEESFIVFDQGRPAYAQGPDGSYVRITYDEVSAERLTGSAKVYDAATGQTQTFSVNVDLRATAAQVAETVTTLTGQTLAVPDLPTQTGKALSAALRINIDSSLFALLVVPVVLAVDLCVVVMGQVMAAMFVAVAAVTKAAILAAFSPLFLVAALLGEVLVRVEYVPLWEVFTELPEAPQIDITIK